MKDLLFYDIECYTHDAFVVIKDIDKNVLGLFTDKYRFIGLSKLIEGKTMVGFNNYWYDDHMLSAMLNGWTAKQLKELNDRIIGGQKQYPQKKFKSLDVFQQIDVGMPSLKKIEGNRGLKILESSVPFDIGRELTEEEYRECVDYCSYDVDNTIDIYKLRITSYFQPKANLVEMVGQGDRWNTTTLSANALLGNDKLQRWSNIRLNGDDFTDMSILKFVPEEVVEMWKNVDMSGKPKGVKSVTIREFDNDIEFGFGGLHSTNIKSKVFKNVKLLDVASMYPNIILIINALAKSTPKYRQILIDRLKAKAEGNAILSDALKLILNSVYGLLKNQYSALYNPLSALSVCIYGQVALYMLGKMLSPVATIVQLNTDGVAFIPHGEYKHIWKDWEEMFQLVLEEDSFDVLYQKDVNNYIGVKDGQVVKTKGGQTSRYKKDQPFKNNSARILDIALVDYLVHGKSVIDSLIEHLDRPHLYQYILQSGSTYKGTFDVDGNQYNKINRVFPTKKGEFRLYKKRQDDGLVAFADSPEKMFLWNDDCSELKNFERIIDLNHYVSIINKRIDGWV